MQLLDNNKNIINKFSFEDFDTIQGNQNEFELNVSWNHNTNLSELTNKEVYIEIMGNNFELYSIEYMLLTNTKISPVENNIKEIEYVI